jgi:uncharacterized protein YjbI with pentapeptide repeats
MRMDESYRYQVELGKHRIDMHPGADAGARIVGKSWPCSDFSGRFASVTWESCDIRGSAFSADCDLEDVTFVRCDLRDVVGLPRHGVRLIDCHT